MKIWKKAFRETVWFIRHNWVPTFSSLVVAAIFGTVYIEFPIAKWKENTMVEFGTYLVSASLLTIMLVYIGNYVQFATVDLYQYLLKRIGIAKVRLSPHTPTGTCNSYKDIWCCLSLQNMDWNDPIVQSHCRVEKLWRVGDRSSMILFPKTAKASWKGKKPISEQVKQFYSDVKARENSVWYIAYLDEENELVVLDTSDGIVCSIGKGIYNIDIVIGGALLV